MKYPLRINKYLAEMGFASRREADTLIEKGDVLINKKVAKLGDKVEEGDKVSVKGIDKKKKVYYLYYKPTGVVSVNAQKGEKEIKDVTKFPEKVFPIGRLDKESEGLIIMTNDGQITDKLLSPENHYEKEYYVETDKPVTHKLLVNLIQGINIGGYKTKKAKARRKDKKSFEIVITEGKNRQIRKMCGALGFKVTKLKRIRLGNLKIGGLKPGNFKPIKPSDLGL